MDVPQTAVIESRIPPPLPPVLPWGFWPTVGFSAIIAMAFLAAQTVVMIVFVALATAQDSQLDVGAYAGSLEGNGLLLALATLTAMPVCVGLVVLFAKIRRGCPLRDYLGLKPITGKAFLPWLLLLIALVVVTDLLMVLVGRPIVPEVMLDSYRTAGFTPLLWLAVIVAAPVTEELFVRGFMLPGLRQSRLGNGGAVVVTALGWAVVHLQYDLVAMAVIFLGGLLLGAARIKTGSVYACLGLHACMNLVATVETMILVRTQ